MRHFVPVIAVLALAVCPIACSFLGRASASSRPSGGRGLLRVGAKAIVAGGTTMRLVGASRGGVANTDADGDGLDDAWEDETAKAYFPYYSLHARDGCTRHGVLFRLSPHPDDPTKIAIWYVVLFERDCGGVRGIGSHIGDDEVFGEVVDPARPAPSGILAIRAISHQNTTCERVTTCGNLPGCAPCAVATKNGAPYPVVFSSLDKHGNYASETACNFWPCDVRGCEVSAAPDAPPFVNAGEPSRPLTNDLETNGFVNARLGWTEPSLSHFDPWSGRDFGGAGSVASDLVDTSFLVSPDGC